jgi:hypothetical protein
MREFGRIQGVVGRKQNVTRIITDSHGLSMRVSGKIMGINCSEFITVDRSYFVVSLRVGTIEKKEEETGTVVSTLFCSMSERFKSEKMAKRWTVMRSCHSSKSSSISKGGVMNQDPCDNCTKHTCYKCEHQIKPEVKK